LIRRWLYCGEDSGGDGDGTTSGGIGMGDLGFLLLTVGFFGACLAYVLACERL
jgi:hypothetical protein